MQGQPIALDDEFRAFIYRCYEVFPRGHAREGRRVYRRAFLSRSKGRAKSALAGMIVCAEGLAEVRFDGWDANGDPVGRPVTAPVIRCFATEEGQAGNTYDNVVFMLREGTVADEYPGLDVGLTRTFLPDGGRIVALSSSAASKDGGRDTFSVFDEALALDTPLPTPTGWTTMGQVAEGDLLLGSDGLPVTVTKATDVQYGRRCFRVTFEDGSSLVASDGHLWLTRKMSAALPKVRTTGEMHAAGCRFRVPVAAPWKLPESLLPVDPYLLGVWLGDGSTGQPHVAAGVADAPALANELTRRGIDVRISDARADGSVVRLHFSRLTGFHRGTPLGDAFRALPCWKRKHVPEEYFHASIEQRTELVRGLMDTDGHASKRGNCTFVGNDQLTADLRRLLSSLGQVSTRMWVSDPRSRQGGYYKVHFTARGGFQPFSLPRKARLVRQHARGPEWVSIVSIEPVEPVPVRCVAVDASDHLFLAGEHGHVTHNTHLWILPELKRLHSTVTRNLMKRKMADGWALETSTMYAPGEGSVAEETHKSARSTPGVLFDHKEAPRDLDLNDDAAVLEALKSVYGPAAAWMDLEAIVTNELRDPQKRESDFRRYWLNQPWSLEERFVRADQWDACAVPDRFDTPSDEYGQHPIPDGEDIVLAFDGSKNNDWTVLVAVLVDAQPHVHVVGTWQRPEGPYASEWEPPVLEVEQAIRDACDRWNVREIAADVAWWQRSLQLLASEGFPAVSFPQTATRMTPATKQLHDLITTKSLTHSGDARLRAHMLNAVAKDDYRGYRITKQSKDSPYKVDLAVATVMGVDRAMSFVTAPSDYAHVFFASDAIPKPDPIEQKGPKIIFHDAEATRARRFKSIYDQWAEPEGADA